MNKVELLDKLTHLGEYGDAGNGNPANFTQLSGNHDDRDTCHIANQNWLGEQICQKSQSSKIPDTTNRNHDF